MTLDARLDNWGRGVRGGGIPLAGCASLEGAYRAPIGQEVEWETGDWLGDGVPTSRLPVDVRDAWAIERAVCALPVYDHALLRGWYVYRLRPWDALAHAKRAARWQRLGLAVHYAPSGRRLTDFDAALVAAKVALTAQLAVPAVVHRRRAVLWVRQVLVVGPASHEAAA